MDVTSIIAEIDSQIAKLQQARDIIAGTTPAKTGAKRGRPKGSKNSTTKASLKTTTATPAKSKRKLSAEGRKAIADAMKKRWAERKKLAVK